MGSYSAAVGSFDRRPDGIFEMKRAFLNIIFLLVINFQMNVRHQRRKTNERKKGKKTKHITLLLLLLL